MNIQQILTEGQGLVLNSVTVKQDYGIKNGQTPHRALLIEDASAKTIIKLWGAPSSQGFNDGDVITIQGVGEEGNIRAQEWKGKYSLNANSCEIIRGGSTQAPYAPPSENPPQAPQAANANPQAPHTKPQTASQGYSRPPANSGALDPEQLSQAQSEHFRRIFTKIEPLGTAMGADPSSIMLAAAQMTGSAAQWFFGEKYPGYQDNNRL